MPRGRRWTEEERLLLESLIMARKSHAEIGTELNRTASAVKNQAGAEGISKPLLNDEWLRLVALPHTLPELAGRMSVSVNVAKHAKARMKKMGFKVFRCRSGPIKKFPMPRPSDDASRKG